VSEVWNKGQGSLLSFLLGSGANPYLFSKTDAAYQDRPHNKQRCGNCASAYSQVVTGDLFCSQVEGKIELDDWCRLWNMDRN